MDTQPVKPALRLDQRVLKRSFDFCLALFGLILTWWLILFAYIAATIDTKANGFFTQDRVGYGGKLFKIIKIRTMRVHSQASTVTTANDDRLTKLGKILRKFKIDELPQLLNVLKGEMSFVGPRPDVPGFADRLATEDRIILGVRPGITGPATLAFRDEEQLLAQQEDPERYNAEVIWPKKIGLNKSYIEDYSLKKDLYFILKTIFSGGKGRTRAAERT